MHASCCIIAASWASAHQCFLGRLEAACLRHFYPMRHASVKHLAAVKCSPRAPGRGPSGGGACACSGALSAGAVGARRTPSRSTCPRSRSLAAAPAAPGPPRQCTLAQKVGPASRQGVSPPEHCRGGKHGHLNPGTEKLWRGPLQTLGHSKACACMLRCTTEHLELIVSSSGRVDPPGLPSPSIVTDLHGHGLS